MKRFLIFAAAAVMMASCGNKAEVEKLQKQLDSLKGEKGNSDASIEQYIADFNEIQDNLNEIKKKEGVISSSNTGGELSEDSKTRIQNDLYDIQKLMDDNKAKIADLQKKLKNSGNKNAELQKLISGLEERVASQEQEIASLKQELASANIRIAGLSRSNDSLSLENTGKDAKLSEQDIALNTAFYCVGTYKELLNNKVIDKGGAFAAKSGSKLSKDLNMNYLTKVDVRNLGEVSLPGKKVRLVTSHPSGSYMYDGDAKKPTKLVITDKQKFWSNSKYCVIQVD